MIQAIYLFFRRLYSVISLLIHKDEDIKSEGGNKEKESLPVIISIFQGIKCSEDLVDAAKTKVSQNFSNLYF